jgi:hypothetical protein
MERNISGAVRGTADSKIRLCRECGRLLYWPMPMDKWYILSQYWPKGHEVTLISNEIYCTPRFFSTTLAPLRFPKLANKRLPILNEAIDALPTNYSDMLATLSAQGRTE